MPHLPLEGAPHECGKSQSSEGHLKTDDRVGTIAMDSEGLTTEQLRFAEALGQALVGAWQRESAPVVAINGLSGTGGATEANA
jgi:hypothetical protein